MIPAKSKQVNTIIHALQAVANQNYSHKLPLSTYDDFYNAVATAINTLIENLEERVVEKTKLEESQKQLNIALERLNGTLEQTVDAVITINQDNKIIMFNKAAEKIFGFKKKDVLFKNVNALFPLEQKYRYEKLISLAMTFDPSTATQKLNELNFYRKDGNWFWASISLSRVAFGEEVLLTTFIKDITEKKEYDDNIKRINNLLRKKSKSDSDELDHVKIIIDLVFGNLPVQFLAFDNSGKALYTRGADLLKIENLLPELDIFSIFNTNPKITEHFHLLLSGKKCQFIVERDEIFFEVNIRPSYDGVGKFMHFGCIIADVTDIMLAQIKMERAYEREKELGILKSKFITGVSHQFRTPLTSIQSNFDLINIYAHREEYPSPHLTKLMVNKIGSAITEMTSLLSNMLTLSEDDSKIRQSLVRQSDLVSMCDKLLEKIKPNKFNIKGSPRKIALNPDTFSVALREVFSNANKFSNGKSFEVTLNYKTEETLIIVKDKGIGFSTSESETIFEPYYRTEEAVAYSGNGTGLTIAKKYIYSNQGTISVQSSSKKGSVFEIKLKQ